MDTCYIFAVNMKDIPVSVDIPCPMKDVLQNKICSGKTQIHAYDLLWLKK